MSNLILKIKKELDPTTVIQIVIVLAVLLTFFLIPLLTMVAMSFYSERGLTLEWFWEVLTNPAYFRLTPEGQFMIYYPHAKTLYIQGVDLGIIPNSLVVALSTSLLTTLIGVSLAVLLARYDFPGKRIISIVAVFPLIATPFVNAFVIKMWITMDHSLLNTIFYEYLHLLPFRINIDGLAAVVLVQTMTFYPIVYLNAYASIINIDPAMEEQAENLGAKGFRILRTVTLPLAMPGIAAGAILVFIFSLEDLGAPIVFSSHPLARKLMSYKIYSEFYANVLGGVKPDVLAVSVILLMISLAGFFIIKKYISLRSYAMVVKGGRWSPRTRRLSNWQAALVLMVLIPFLIFCSLPQIGVIVFSFGELFSGPLPLKYGLSNYAKVFSEPSLVQVVSNSLKYSIIAVLVSAVVALSASYIASRRRFFGVELLDAMLTLPLAVPGIVVAVGYITVFGSPILAPTPLYILANPGLLIALAYSVRRMPFMARPIYAGLQQVSVSLEEASFNLGAGRLRTLYKIVVPLIIANILSGVILTFVYCMNEVSVSVTIGGISNEIHPITFHMKDLITRASGGAALAAALGVLLMSMQLTAITVSNIILKQKVSFLGV